MSSKSESSHANSGSSLSSRGIPLKCGCGISVRRYTSSTSDNPGRPFFRCESMNQKKHLFKWVEDALLEEVEDLATKAEATVDDVNQIRSNVDSLICENYNLQKYVSELKEELRMVKLVCGGLAVVVCGGLISITKLLNAW